MANMLFLAFLHSYRVLFLVEIVEDNREFRLKILPQGLILYHSLVFLRID